MTLPKEDLAAQLAPLLDNAEPVPAPAATCASVDQVAPSAAGTQHTVSIIAGRLREAIDGAEAALVAVPGLEPVYQRGAHLVRVARTDAPTIPRRGVEVPTHVPIITPCGDTWLAARLEESASFIRYNAIGDAKPCGCPENVVKGLMQSRGQWRVPVLRATTTTPTLRADGSVLQDPGYDVESRILYDPAGITFPRIPEAPTLDDARAAAQYLLALVATFPLVSPGARSVWVAAALTALIRAQLASAPLTAFDSPTAGSGKTKCATVVGVIATGRPPTTFSFVVDPDEQRKRLFSIFLAGVPVANIDNVEGAALGGAALCQALTEPTFADRLLGGNQVGEAPTTCTWLATGNNLVIAGDIRRRTLVARLDPACERPEERPFDFDPVDVALRDRPALVAAALTILRAHAVAGRPIAAGLTPFGSFEAWSEIVRAAIVWCGLEDPCLGRSTIVEDDGGHGAMLALLTALRTRFGDQAFTVRVALDVGGAIKEAAEELVGVDFSPGGLARKLGMVLSGWRDRVVGGLAIRVVAGTAHGGLRRWRVTS